MRIVHASDWHWSFSKLPEADLYAFTGDMMMNYPVKDKPMDRRRIDGTWGYRIEPENERIRQGEDVKHFLSGGGFRQFLGSPDAPIIAVRGNHDFIDIGRLFEGCNFVHEFKDNEVVEVLGLRATGHRGIPYIYGSWNDEVQRPDLMDKCRSIPDDVDLILTHYPPNLVLDQEVTGHGASYRVESYGLEMMSHYVLHRLRPKGVHMFGHIHGSGGKVQHVDDVIFSNAATTYNILEV
jgi:Icc-related predicted phosphoesterase